MIPLRLPTTSDTLTMESHLLTPCPESTLATAIAGSALRSYAVANTALQLAKGRLVVHEASITQHNHLYGKGEPQPVCLMGVQDQDAASLLTLFFDNTALLWRSAFDLGDRHFEPYPIVFKLKNSVQPLTSERGALKTMLHKKRLRLGWTPTGSTGTHLIDVDPKKLPLEAGVIYVKLMEETLAWTRLLPLEFPIAFTKDGTGVHPAALPKSTLDKTQLAALHTHLELAAVLICHHLQANLSAWGGVVRARMPTQKGGLSAPQIDIKAFNKTQQPDKTLVTRIERAFLAALKHPTCPVPYATLVDTHVTWAGKKKVDRSRTMLTPTLLWSGRFLEGVSAHKTLEALTHFQTPGALFPGA